MGLQTYEDIKEQCNDIAAYSLQCNMTLYELEQLIKKTVPSLMSLWKEIKRERRNIYKHTGALPKDAGLYR